MSSRKSSRRGKKGRAPAGTSDAIDGNINDHERRGAHSDVEISRDHEQTNPGKQFDVEILKKENEMLKKEIETIKVEHERLKNEIQKAKNELLEIYNENEQLKQDKRKLQDDLEKSQNVDNGLLQVSEMEIENDCFIEDSRVSTQNLLDNSENHIPTHADTAGDDYFHGAHAKPTMDRESSGEVNEDRSSPNKDLWSNSIELGRKDDGSWWDEKVTEGNRGQRFDVACGGREGQTDQKSYYPENVKFGWVKQRNAAHDYKGGNVRQYGNKERRGNETNYNPANKESGYRGPHGRQDLRHDDFEGSNVPHGIRKRYKEPGDRQEDHFHDSRARNDWQYRNRRREGNQQRYDNSHQRYDNKKEYSSKVNIIDTDGDLFSAPEDHSLAHCVAADLRMGSGIAVQFKQQFKNVGELAGQRRKVGQVAVLEDKGRYIYYLITKKFSTGKPRLSDLEDSLQDMKKHVLENQVKNIAIPRLGCGLDRLNWKEVRQSLQKIFADVDVTITVYNFTIEMQTTSIQPSKKTSKGLYITNHLMRLIAIERSTLLVVFGSECGFIDKTMQELDEKFRFVNDYKTKFKTLGDVLELHTKCGEIICILIVKKNKDDFISYPTLEACLTKLKKIFKKNEYTYMGLQAFMDADDDLTVAKIVTLLKTVFAYTEGEAWICWPEELKNIYEDYQGSNLKNTYQGE